MTRIARFKPRDYQVDAVYDALRYNRKLLISPTASGKSLMIYSVVRYFAERDKKILLVVSNHISRRADVQGTFKTMDGTQKIIVIRSIQVEKRQIKHLSQLQLGSLFTNYKDHSSRTLKLLSETKHTYSSLSL